MCTVETEWGSSPVFDDEKPECMLTGLGAFIHAYSVSWKRESGEASLAAARFVPEMSYAGRSKPRLS
jgi:hypothetical protein